MSGSTLSSATPADVQPQRTVSGTQSLIRSSVSSGIATLADGLVYQALLFVWVGRYGVAAALGAVAGAITNFVINRQWSFAATHQNVLGQIIRYGVTSGLTFAGLRFLLWFFIEVATWGERVAWLPAKVLAFLAVSFPLQRYWVFRTESK